MCVHVYHFLYSVKDKQNKFIQIRSKKILEVRTLVFFMY
nr:MAG TPA: hypothetical protein [Caudoviricetes sp.]